LYDVTSSFVEGEKIALTEFGYNRDCKKGKKQIVIGLLTDREGDPLSIEVFEGNTNDFLTVKNQLKKMKSEFKVKNVVFVGDRGMTKSAQIKDIKKREWNYITAVTKPQIEKMIADNTIQYGLFDEKIIEVECDGIRYI